MHSQKSNQLTCVFLLMTCPTANAIATNATLNHTKGFTAGLGFGLTSFVTNTSYNMIANNTTSSGSAKQHKYGALGDLFVGYGRSFNDTLYLGGELGLTLVSPDSTSLSTYTTNNTIATQTTRPNIQKIATINTALTATTRVSQNNVIPVFDIKPGFFITPSALLFARLGINYNQLQINSTSNYNTSGIVRLADGTPVGAQADASSIFSTLEKKNIVGMRGGLGFEYMVTPTFSVGANYIYTHYSKISTSGSSASNQIACDTYEGCSSQSGGRNAISSASNVSAEDIMLQLIYHFA